MFLFLNNNIMYFKANGLLVLLVENLNICLIDDRFCVSPYLPFILPFLGHFMV